MSKESKIRKIKRHDSTYSSITNVLLKNKRLSKKRYKNILRDVKTSTYLSSTINYYKADQVKYNIIPCFGYDFKKQSIFNKYYTSISFYDASYTELIDKLIKTYKIKFTYMYYMFEITIPAMNVGPGKNYAFTLYANTPKPIKFKSRFYKKLMRFICKKEHRYSYVGHRIKN